MKVTDAVDKILDADREAGRITNWLYAGEFTDKELRDTVAQIEDLADELETLAEKLADGASEGKKAEMAGWVEDAACCLDEAAKAAAANDISEACISLEAASEKLMEACDAADH